MDSKQISELRKELHSDWLQRDADGYVFRGTGKFGWQKDVPAAGSYSSLITGSKDPKDLIKKAYVLASRTVKTMHLKKAPVIRFNKSSYTDGNNIAVGTSIFDDAMLTPAQQIDGFIGLAVHEASHILYSDFGLIGQMPDKFTKNLLNIVEDERIERLTCKERNFLSGYLRMAKIHMFQHYRESALANGKVDTDANVTNLVNAILMLVRYPSLISDSDIENFNEPLLRIKNEVLVPAAENENPTPYDMAIAARKIRDIIKEFFQLPENQPKNDEKDNKDDKRDDDQQESDENNQNQNGNGNDRQPDDSKQNGQSEGSQPEDGTTADGQEQPQPNKNGKHSLSKEQIDEALKKLGTSMEEIVASPGDGMDERKISRTVQGDTLLQGVCCGEIKVMPNTRSIVKNTNTTPFSDEDFDDSYNRMKKYIPAMRNVLECNSEINKYCIRGQKSGRLDRHKLIQGYLGSETIYEQRGEVKGGRVAVCVLIDESGSMDGRNIEMARDMAVLLHEALADLPNVDSFFFGHTTDKVNGQVSVIIDDFNAKGKRKALGALSAQYGNYDNIALVDTAKLVRQQTKEDCLMFIISDGAPNCANPHEELAKAEKTLNEMNISLVSIGIEVNLTNLYRHHIDFLDESDLVTFPNRIGKLITKALESKTERS